MAVQWWFMCKFWLKAQSTQLRWWVELTVRLIFFWAPGTKGRDAGSWQFHGQWVFSQPRCRQTGFAWLTSSQRKLNSAAVVRHVFHALVTLCLLHSLASKPRSACGISASCLMTWMRLCPSALCRCFLTACCRLLLWQGLGSRSPHSTSCNLKTICVLYVW